MLRSTTLVLALIFATSTVALAEGTTQYARFQFGNRAAIFQSAEKTVAATEHVRSGDLAEMYKAISGKEWTTEREVKGGTLEIAFLDALAEQGWEVAQLTYRENNEAIYLLRKQK